MSSDYGRWNEAELQSLTELAATSGGGKLRELLRPDTGGALISLHDATTADVEAAEQIGRRAQSSWGLLPVHTRRAPFLRLHDLILDRIDEACDLLQLETGKSRRSALEEVLDIAIVARHYAHAAPRLLATKRRKGALPLLTRTHERHAPIGLIGMIAPWNYPLTLAVTDAIPALIAGNAVLLKPAPNTPLTALWIARQLALAGLPEGLFQVLPGAGKATGGAVIDASDMIVFTGSTAVGAEVAARAAGQLKQATLELGGKNPMILLPDAPLKRTVEGAVQACFANTGQLCISAERIYVHRAQMQRFIKAFAARVERMKLGVGTDWSIEMASLISQAQLESVSAHVQDAVDNGATVVTGGEPRPDIGPFCYAPTILTDVNEKMRLHREEVFGPVVSVYPYDRVEQAIELANDSSYGLAASIWTARPAAAERLATRLQAGTVSINEGYAAGWASVDAPMGGFKRSGLGRRHGRQGLLKYTEAQTIATQRLLPIAGPPALPGAAYRKIMELALRALKRLPGLR